MYSSYTLAFYFRKFLLFDNVKTIVKNLCNCSFKCIKELLKTLKNYTLLNNSFYSIKGIPLTLFISHLHKILFSCLLFNIDFAYLRIHKIHSHNISKYVFRSYLHSTMFYQKIIYINA